MQKFYDLIVFKSSYNTFKYTTAKGTTKNAFIKGPKPLIHEISIATIQIAKNLANMGHQYPFTNSFERFKAAKPFIFSKIKIYIENPNHTAKIIPGTINKIVGYFIFLANISLNNAAIDAAIKFEVIISILIIIKSTYITHDITPIPPST